MSDKNEKFDCIYEEVEECLGQRHRKWASQVSEESAGAQSETPMSGSVLDRRMIILPSGMKGRRPHWLGDGETVICARGNGNERQYFMY